MATRAGLAIYLSRLKVFDQAEMGLEQYPTDAEIASTILWSANMRNLVRNKHIADLGSGTGILGIGALLLGARKVDFIEKDKKALDILRLNLKDFRSESYTVNHCDISDYSEKTDLVIQNPPFGTKNRHADTDFLIKAFQTSDNVISLHKTSTKDFILKTAKTNGFHVYEVMDFDYLLKRSMYFHRKEKHIIKVSAFFMKKEDMVC